VTRELAECLARTRWDDLSPATVEHARRAVLDWLGSALAGALEPPARMARRVARGLGASTEATLFAAGRGSAAAAALANGVASHILELDDVHKGSTLHPAAPVIPAALAVAEREHRDGRAFLLAVVLGYDAALRIGEAVNPSHYRFWHPTGTAGTFGAAAAAASLLGLDAARMVDALGSAGTQAAGLWEFNADGAMSKHLHPGKAAMNGVLSADLARSGFTGAARILEGDRGFFAATSTSHDATRITERLGTHWKISENCYKLHSCCGHTHTAIDCAVDLAPRPEEIESIDIETYGPGYAIVRNPRPATPYQAKFSIAYCVAAALLDCRCGLDQFALNRIADPAIAALLSRTRVSVADDLTARYPAAWPCRLSIRLHDGRTLRAAADFPRGNPENPIPTEALEAKFRGLVEPRFGVDAATRALETVRSLESRADMADVFSNLVPAST
jgi:2-methylcitrate dehydratase PrpD